MTHHRTSSIEWEFFRAEVRKRRMELGYTQEEVSDMIGMNKGYVSNVESKTAFTPSFGAAIKWLAALDGTMRIDWGNDGRDRHHETDSPE